ITDRKNQTVAKKERKFKKVADRGEGGDDGVVYLGRSSFKMKVGAGGNVTPPAGTPVGRVSRTPSSLKTPPPRLSSPAHRRVTTATPMPPLAAPSPPTVQAPPPSSGKGKVMMVGVCMIAFS